MRPLKICSFCYLHKNLLLFIIFLLVQGVAVFIESARAWHVSLALEVSWHVYYENKACLQ